MEVKDFGALRFMSALVERARFAARAGITFGGKRDVYEVLGYERVLTPALYRDRYERDGMAATVVEAMPKATWRGGGEVIEDENPDRLTEFERIWNEMQTRLRAWSKFQRADILSGLGEYAIIVIGAPGRFEEPLQSATAEQIAYLRPYGQDVTTIEQTDLEANAESPRWGWPNFYSVKVQAATSTASTMTRKVHYTRVVHVADGLLDSEIYSEPKLRRIWNRLDDLEKVVGGGAEAHWIRANQGLQLDIDKDVTVSPEEIAKLREQADEYQHGIRRMLRTRGTKVTTLGSDVANFDKNADAIIKQISAATGIPQRILTGSERGELASSQDADNWNTRVQDRREDFAEAGVIRPLIDRLVQLGALPAPKEYEVRWPEIDDLTDAEKAELSEKMAGTNQKMGETVFLPNEIRDRVWGWDPLDPDVLAERAEDVEVEEDPEADPEDPEADPRAAVSKREQKWLKKKQLTLSIAQRTASQKRSQR